MEFSKSLHTKDGENSQHINEAINCTSRNHWNRMLRVHFGLH